MANYEEIEFEDVVFKASKAFLNHFSSEPLFCGCAPGRINLIGEHTDYNDGYVLPMALPMVTVVVGRRNNSSVCNVVTTSPEIDETHAEFKLPNDELGDKISPGKPAWSNYIKGVVSNFKGTLCGFNAVIATSVPVGGGLSSSAALEVATYAFLEAIAEEKSTTNLKDKAQACQRAENMFCGVPCGIMDQFASFMGKKDHALLIDCRSLESTLVPMRDPEVAILITNTNVPHKLVESQYSIRRQQCETACKIIGKSSLRDATVEDLNAHKQNLGDKIYCRAHHVISEIERTLKAALALQNEHYEDFGKLMQQSHKSLRDDYEVSCPELDLVVEAALEVEGVYGSRMTGGGFGGCTVTLLKASAIERTIQNIKMKYDGQPSFYICKPGDGARNFKL